MQRSASLALACALALATVVPGIAVARGPMGHATAGGHAAVTRTTEKAGAKGGKASAKAPKPVVLKVKTSTGHPGGTARVGVVAPGKVRLSAVAAVVHFASGDVTVALASHGASAAARVAVPADAVSGEVAVDVSAMANGVAVTATGTMRIIAPEPTPVPSAAPTEVPSDAPSAAPSEEPSAAPSEEPSVVPSAAPSDAPSSLPSDAPSADPSAAPSDAPSAEPAPASGSDPVSSFVAFIGSVLGAIFG